MIFSLLSGKGGTGKTTLSLNLADALTRGGRSVALIDADPQGSARDWARTRRKRPAFTTIALPLEMVHSEVARFRRGIAFDYIVIDSPPRMADRTRSIILASDLVVMPVSPSAFDVWALQKTIQQVEAARASRPSLRAVFLINRRNAESAVGRAIERALRQFDIPILSSTVHEHPIFCESAATGQTVLEANPNSPAALEIYAAAREIAALNNPHAGRTRHHSLEAAARL